MNVYRIANSEGNSHPFIKYIFKLMNNLPVGVKNPIKIYESNNIYEYISLKMENRFYTR